MRLLLVSAGMVQGCIRSPTHWCPWASTLVAAAAASKDAGSNLAADIVIWQKGLVK